ncbi:MAG: DUF2306 domain-containing protein [Pseudomonadota bacterium]
MSRSRRRARLWPATLAALLLALLAAPFAHYAATLGWAGLTTDLWPGNRFDPPGVASSSAIYLHMLAGGAITVLAPLQTLPAIRNRAPAVHRWSGRLVVAAALLTAAAGLLWIFDRGTIGGPHMSYAFALYGALMGVAAAQTYRFARARQFERHRRWALRLTVLALASWAYRVHYGVWFAATGGIASNAAFTGLFDRIQIWAFYLPYLAALELWFRLRRGARATSATPA